MQRKLSGTWEPQERVPQIRDTRLDFSSCHRGTRCRLQLYERICLSTWRRPSGDVRGHIFHMLISLHICPRIWVALYSTVSLTCAEFDGDSREEELLARDRQWVTKHSRAQNFCRDNFGTSRKMSLFSYHLMYQFYQLFLNLYIIWKGNRKTCLT